MRHGLSSLGAAAVAVVLATTTTHAEPTRDYVVRSGDSCTSIAERELGDREAIAKIHALNPQLGKLPHNLKAGSVMRLPVIAAPDPDAKLSSSRGEVRVRKPELDNWSPAARGMDLFRAWRVNSETQSSAEVTFQDTSRLFMRENTIVIIFGPVANRAKISSSEAVLETGALESRLDAASKRKLVVRTPSSEAQVGAGHSLVTVDKAGDSIVGNHGGAAVSVRGVDAQRKPRGAAVSVAAGMGSKIIRGKPPAPPRKLPAAPSWTAGPRRFVDAAGGGATVAIGWSADPTAAQYRVEIVGADGGERMAVHVPATASSFEAHQLAPGAYVAHVSMIDTEGFESIRSADAAFEVVAVAVYAPGASAPIALASAPATPPSPLALATGSRVVAPTGMTCAQGEGTASAELVLTGTGAIAVRCTGADGAASPPLTMTLVPVEINGSATGAAAISRTAPAHVAIHVTSTASVGDELVVRAAHGLRVLSTTRLDPTTLDVVVQATEGDARRGQLVVATKDLELGTVDVDIAAPAPAPRPATPPRADHLSFSVGALAGAHVFSHTSELGVSDAPSAPSQADGGLVGGRVAALYDDLVGIEAEVGVVPSTPRGQSARVTDLAYRAHAIGQLRAGDPANRLLPFAVAGFGAVSVVATNAASIKHDTDTGFYVGAGLKYRATPAWGLRADGRMLLLPSSAVGVQVTTDFELMLGIDVQLGRLRW